MENTSNQAVIARQTNWGPWPASNFPFVAHRRKYQKYLLTQHGLYFFSFCLGCKTKTYQNISNFWLSRHRLCPAYQDWIYVRLSKVRIMKSKLTDKWMGSCSPTSDVTQSCEHGHWVTNSGSRHFKQTCHFRKTLLSMVLASIKNLSFHSSNPICWPSSFCTPVFACLISFHPLKPWALQACSPRRSNYYNPHQAGSKCTQIPKNHAQILELCHLLFWGGRVAPSIETPPN